MITFIAWGTSIMGGVQNLILNISKELNNKNQKAKIFGYKTCLIYKDLVNRKIEFDFYDLEKIDTKSIANYLTEEDIIVFGSYYPRFLLYKFKKANPRILYWNVFPNTLTVANKVRFIDFKDRTRNLIRKLSTDNSVVFMDINGVKSIQDEIDSTILNKDNIKYLPIPVEIKNTNLFLRREFSDKKIINLTYVGRAILWKMQPLRKIIIDVIKLELDKSFLININIVTQEEEEYKVFIEDLILPEFVTITYHDNLYGDKYKDFLINTSDLHFAMGTSALDGAALGIPTIVIDYSTQDFPSNYKYLWLYDTIGYDLGHLVENSNRDNAKTMKQLIDLYCLKDYKKLTEISQETYKYVVDNHDISIVVNKLLIISKQAEGRAKTVVNLTIINNPIVKLLMKLIGRDLMKA